MKKFFILIGLIVCALYARMPAEGESVDVELKSGLKQRAKFVGIHQDTILLGGYIKNQFSVVRIPKSSFANIKSKDGEMLSLEIEEDIAPEDSSDKVDSLQAVLPDSSTQIAEIDTTKQDSAGIVKDWKGKTLFIPFNRRPIDSSFTENLQNVLFALLDEERLNPVKPNETELDGCTEPSCIIKEARENQVKGAFFGNVQATPSDSILIELTYFNENNAEPEEASFKVSSKNPLASAVASEAMHNALLKLLGKEVKVTVPDTIYKSPTVHYVYVETEPEDALLSKTGEEPICRTPCSFATQDTGSIEVFAYWDVDEHLWAATTKIHIIPGDTAKASVKLQKVNPAVYVVTHPEGAEIYPDLDTIKTFTSRLGVTPKALQTKILGDAKIKIVKEGYKDTTVNFYVMPTEKNKLDINLTPLTIPAEIEAQQEWFKEQRNKKIGITLMGASVVPLIFGSIFTYLASKDYDKAKDIREELKTPHVGNGTQYEKKKQENKDMANRGDKKLIIGMSSFGLAAGLLVTGIIFTF